MKGGISGKLKFKLDFLLLIIPFGMFFISLSLSLICLFWNLSWFCRAIIREFYSLVLSGETSGVFPRRIFNLLVISSISCCGVFLKSGPGVPSSSPPLPPSLPVPPSSSSSSSLFIPYFKHLILIVTYQFHLVLIIF